MLPSSTKSSMDCHSDLSLGPVYHPDVNIESDGPENNPPALHGNNPNRTEVSCCSLDVLTLNTSRNFAESESAPEIQKQAQQQQQSDPIALATLRQLLTDEAWEALF